MSKQGLKIPTKEKPRIWTGSAFKDPPVRTAAEEEELQALMSDTNLPVQPQSESIAGVPVEEYVKDIGKAVVKTGKKIIPAARITSLIFDATPTGMGNWKKDKDGKTYYDKPVIVSSKTGRRMFKDPRLREANLDRWGSRFGKKGLLVDQYGKPIVFEHGTPDFVGDTLLPSKAAKRSEFKGVYATTDKKESPKYMRLGGKIGKNPKVLKLFIRMYKPLVLTSPEGEVGMDSFAMNDMDTGIISNALVNLRIQMEGLDVTNPNHSTDVSKIKLQSQEFRTPREITEYLKYIDSDLEITEFLETLGYDGVLSRDDPTQPDEYKEAVMFKEDAAKSADENLGTFQETGSLFTKIRKKDLQIVA